MRKDSVRFSCARKERLNYFLKYLWWIIHLCRWDILSTLQLTGYPTENWNSYYGGINKNHRTQGRGETLSIKFPNPKFGNYFFLILGEVQYGKQVQTIGWCLYYCILSLYSHLCRILLGLVAAQHACSHGRRCPMMSSCKSRITKL